MVCAGAAAVVVGDGLAGAGVCVGARSLPLSVKVVSGVAVPEPSASTVIVSMVAMFA